MCHDVPNRRHVQAKQEYGEYPDRDHQFYNKACLLHDVWICPVKYFKDDRLHDPPWRRQEGMLNLYYFYHTYIGKGFHVYSGVTLVTY